jgi:hypothetical protein
MKNIIITMLLFCSALSFADEMPEYMKDGVITVTLKDGSSHKFSTNEYKVVKRESLKNVVVEHDEQGSRKVYQSPAMAVAGPNSVRAFGGAGPSGLSVTTGASSVTIEQSYGFVYGAGYQRQLDSRWSVEAIGLSNKTGLLGVGLSF